MNDSFRIIFSHVNDVLTDSCRDPVEALYYETRLREDLRLDSLELAVLTVKIEAETGVDVFADGIVETVGQIIEKLER